MEQLNPNGQRAKNAITLIWVVLVLEIIMLISSYFQYDLLQIAKNGGEISMEAADANDTREQIIGIIYSIAFIISTVTFIQWFRRAYFNLHLKVNNLSHTEGWAAGSWFVPIISLYRPYQIMKELYQETKGLLTRKGLIVSEEYSTSYLGWWWTLWIINNIIGQIIFRYPSETIDELIGGTVASMIGSVIGIPLALITIKVIKDYSDIEPLLNEIKDEEEITTHNNT
jgi:hypothetical protein